MLSRLLRVRLRPYRGQIAIIVVLQLAQTVAALYLPTLNADIIDNGVVEGDTGHILAVGPVMLGVSLLQIAVNIVAVLLAARCAMAVGRDLRAEVFARVQSFSAREFGRFGVASLTTRTTNDVQHVQTVLMLVFTLTVPAPIMAVGGVVLALRQDGPLSVLLLVMIPLLTVLIGVVVARLRPLYQSMQVLTDRIGQVLREQVGGVRVVRAFGRTQHELDRAGRVNDELNDVSLRVGRFMALLVPAVTLVVNVASVAVLWFGGIRLDAGDMRVGALTAFLNYLVLVFIAVVMAMTVFTMLGRADAAAGRVGEVLGTKPSAGPPAEPVTGAGPAPGRVELRDVEFRYPGAEKPVLRGVTLSVRPGERVAVVGGTGSGKTTLLNLVARLFDVTGGAVLVDGVDVRARDPLALSTSVGYVPQRAHLFSGTVSSNLRFGRPEATEREMWAALAVAQAAEFVERMPGGLSATIGHGGGDVSGGQRQRLAIARTVLRAPAVYLFDDSFSALDQSTDVALRTALRGWTAGAAVLMVTQRVQAIRDADRIVVLDDGRVVGDGTHDQLLADNDVYREIVRSQLTGQVS